MTCVDVMYQPPGPPGAGFHAYPREPCSLEFSLRHTQAFNRMQEPLDLGISSSFSPAVTSPLTSANSTFKVSTVNPQTTSSTASTSQVSQTSALLSSRTQTSSYREHGRSPSSSLSSLTPPSSTTDVFHYHGNNYGNTHYHHQQQHYLQQHQDEQKHQSQRLTKDEKEKHKVYDEEQELCPVRTDYLGVNCVLNTFISGDVRKAVDDHFTKSMDKQVLQQRSRDGGKSGELQDSLPMADRNLPPSFWNSSYYQLHPQHNNHSIFDHSGGSSSSNYNYHHHYQFPTVGAEGSSSLIAGSSNTGAHNTDILLGGSSTSSGAGFTSGMRSGNDLAAFHSHPAHPYFSPTLQGLSNLQSAVTSDPWSAYCNSFASPATAVPYPHRPVPYDISSYSSTGRFGQKYSSFLMQPSSMRSAHFGTTVSGHSDGQKSSDFSGSSRSRYTDPRLGVDYSSGHHSSFTAFDATSFQDVTSKDLCWF